MGGKWLIGFSHWSSYGGNNNFGGGGQGWSLRPEFSDNMTDIDPRAPQYRSYGMGLSISRRSGVTVVHHGGSLFGYKSDLMYLPDHGVGAVILTNSDRGGSLLGPLRRRLLEVLFDGRPEAAGNVDASVSSFKTSLAKERERLVIPADKKEIATLASEYTSPELGKLTVRASANSTVFDFGEWRSAVATRRNDDGTVSLWTIDPGTFGFEFVRAERAGKRGLVLRIYETEPQEALRWLVEACRRLCPLAVHFPWQAVVRTR